MRRLLLPLALVLAACLAACGDDDPASPTPLAPAATTNPGAHTDAPPSSGNVPGSITFLDGLAAGREAAGSDDALMFVYVARHNPT